MRVYFRIVKLLIFPNKLACFFIVLYRLKEFKIKIDNPVRLCMYQLSCSRYSYRVFKKYNFFRALWLTWQRYYSCNPIRYNENLDIDIKNLFDNLNKK